MILTIETPTKMRVEFSDETEHQQTVECLTYTNTSVAYQIKMTKESAIRYGEEWAGRRLEVLESQLNETLLWADNEGYYTRPGLLRFLQKRFSCSVVNSIQYPEFKMLPWKNTPEYSMHKAQQEAVERMLATPHSHIEFATGVGKTFIIQNLIKSTGLPTIVSTPSKSIARQMYDECVHLFGKQKVGLFGDGNREIGKHILIAISKSLSLVEDPEEIEEFKKYLALLGDESHRIPADESEKYCHGILSHCPYRWFVSGTQERSDGRDLKLLSIIGPQVHNYTVQQAIDDKVLAKLSFMVFNMKSDSYFDSKNLVRMNQEHLYKNMKIASLISDLTQEAVLNNMPTLILVDEHIQEEILRSYMKVDYVYASGESENHKICQDFNDGKILCVVGTSAVSTGTNFKPVRLTINWQAGKSAVKVKQGPIGRSTRTDQRTNKTDCKIVDFRLTNIPTLKRHADVRVGFYKEIGDVQYINID